MSMNVTLLTEQQIWGDDQGNGQLQVMKAYGTKTGMSDLAIALGGYMSTPKTSDGQRTGFVWSASSSGNGYVRAVSCYGDRDYGYPSKRFLGARPALPSSVASSIRLSEAKPSRKISEVDVVEFGEYPQTIATEEVSEKLEKALTTRKLQATGKKYTFDGAAYDAYDTPFSAKEHVEYQHDGKRYIRVEAQPIDGDSVLSNGHTPEKGEACWIEVKPIEWLRDPSGVCVARQALFAGVQFDRNKKYDGNFEKTDMHAYLQNYFAKEMVPSQAQAREESPEEIAAMEAEAHKHRKTGAAWLKSLMTAEYDRMRAWDAQEAQKAQKARLPESSRVNWENISDKAMKVAMFVDPGSKPADRNEEIMQRCYETKSQAEEAYYTAFAELAIAELRDNNRLPKEGAGLTEEALRVQVLSALKDKAKAYDKLTGTGWQNREAARRGQQSSPSCPDRL